MKPGRMALVSVLAFLLLAPLFAGAQASGGSNARGNFNAVTGTIVSFKGLTFVISLADGTQKTVQLGDKALILDREPATASDIKVGDAVGVASRDDNGQMIATSINIFAPEMWSNMRTAQFKMTSGETMTNAMTAQVEQNAQGQVLTLKLDMGTATISVPADAQIHRLVAVPVDQLKVGLKVTFRVQSTTGNTLTALGATFDQPSQG